MKAPDLRRFSQEDYSRLVAKTIEQIQQLSTNKGGEYAGDYDCLANFRRNAQALGTGMELVWAVYAGKHWDAIQRWVRDQQEGKERIRSEPLSGRVDDLIVYCILLKAMLQEREQSKNTSGQGTHIPNMILGDPHAAQGIMSGSIKHSQSY